MLPPDEIAHLLTQIQKVTADDELLEFTIEANPGTVDVEKAKVFVSGGVDRVSLGGQSFFPQELKALDRQHGPEEISQAIQLLRDQGIRRVNLDLIFGIPGQTMDSWRESLNRAIDLGVDHLSCYALTYEAGTRLTAARDAGRIAPCGESNEADMYLMMLDVLSDAGYEQYEISNFAKPNEQCQHNLIYWNNGPYVGVGPSAAGCFNDRRYRNVESINAYVKKVDDGVLPEAESENLDRETIITEMVMMQLRTTRGLSLDAFRDRVGSDPLVRFAPVISKLTCLQLIRANDSHIALTRSGLMVADSIMADLLAARIA